MTNKLYCVCGELPHTHIEDVIDIINDCFDSNVEYSRENQLIRNIILTKLKRGNQE